MDGEEPTGIEGVGAVIDSSAIGNVDLLGRKIGGDGNSNSGNANDDPESDSGDKDNAGGISDTGNSIGGIRVGKPSVGNSGDQSGEWGFRADGTPRRKPGRKPGAGNSGRSSATATKPAKRANGVNGLEKLLLSIHTIAAIKLETPELAIDNSEAAMLANAINAVQEHYGFDVPPEIAIWVNLATALGTVYGPRVISITARRKKNKPNKKSEVKEAPSSVVNPSPDPAMPPTFSIPGMHAPL